MNIKFPYLALTLGMISNHNGYHHSMNNLTDKNQNNPIEVFTGMAWAVALVESLLENAEIEAYIYYGGRGTMAPWVSKGCFPLNRIMVSCDDYEKVKQGVDQYYDAVKE